MGQPKPKSAVDQPKLRREVLELSLLLEISQTLERSMDLRDVLGPALEAMARHMGMLRGTITLLNRDTGEISIEAAYGLSAVQRRRGRYKLGEGVTGKVVATGQPAIVPRVSEEPQFLDRTGVRKGLRKEDISFFCVPIKLENETIGALSATRLFAEDISFDEDVRLLRIIASMISQAVRLRRAAHEEHQRLLEESERLRAELKERFRPSNIIGRSKAMQAVYDLIAQVAKSDTTVLLRGESGVGKELVAHAIHYNSRRADKPFVKVSSAALPETIIESELFGHEKGSFTGAIAQRRGRFELASGGTLFLDEIGDLSPATQIRLLRVLQEKEFERVGGTETVKTDVRIIAATNKSLKELVDQGLFREDLYYRLNVIRIYVPPLRERREDIPPIVDYMVHKLNRELDRKITRLQTPALQLLIKRGWPGNVRQLENVLRRAMVQTHGEMLLEETMVEAIGETLSQEAGRPLPPIKLLDEVEKEHIVNALKFAGGNRGKVCELLGISRPTLQRKIRKYRIEV